MQSVATRLVVERERERMRFVAASYWDVVGTFEPGSFEARLVAIDGTRIAQGRDFGEDGASGGDVLVLDEERARALAAGLEGRALRRPEGRREAVHAPPGRAVPDVDAAAGGEPQAAVLVADDDEPRAAAVRERLHHVHAHRLGDALRRGAEGRARPRARERRRRSTVPAEPRRYERAVANAQEAHEAIRPAGDVVPHAGRARAGADRDELALYDLIFKRTIASQMKDAAGQTVSFELGATTADDTRRFRASGTVITFPGFMLAYASGRDEPAEEDEERRLPAVAVGQELTASSLEPQGHETSPPARYTEASLVKALEDRGIGRPSTYASIMGTILDRGYVYKKGTALVPTFLAFAVTQLLEKHFDRLVDYDFTARLEDDLDKIAAGRRGARRPGSARFYFGNGNPGLHALVTEHLEGIDAREVNSIAIPRSRHRRSASAATARTSSAARSGRACRTTSPPTS